MFAPAMTSPAPRRPGQRERMGARQRLTAVQQGEGLGHPQHIADSGCCRKMESGPFSTHCRHSYWGGPVAGTAAMAAGKTWRRFSALTGRRVIVVQAQDDLFRYENLRRQRDHEPSPDDDTAPVEGGLRVGSGPSPSGHYASAEAAKADARATVDWFAEL
jgi:hypothetical protein